MFLQNGVKISELDDYQQAREFQSKDFQYSVSFLFSLGLIFTASVLSPSYVSDATTLRAIELSLISLLLLNLFVAAYCFKNAAVDREYLPRSQNTDGTTINSEIVHNHVTGFGAAVVVLLIVFLGTAAFLGQQNHHDFTIPEEFGLMVLCGICLGFGGLIFAPRITDLAVLNSALNAARAGTSFLNPLGRFLSRLDSWLVHVIAPISGVTERKWRKRYVLLTGNLATTSAFTWYGTPLLAAVSVAWAIIVAISIFRRWSWIETDRDNQLRGEIEPEFRRVSIEQDLRDEALFALLFLLFVLPLGMRQFHLGLGSAVFTIPQNRIDDPIAWFGFFGVEMIKALPFIDWSDIYGAHGATAVKFDKPIAMHLVFASRVLIDLVFLSALVQAVSISVSLGKHKKRFLLREKGVNRLDPRIEVSELSKLARRGKQNNWEFRPELSKFLHYDLDRLSTLKVKCKNNKRLLAAIQRIFDINNYRYQHPGEILAEEALRAQPKAATLNEQLDLIEELKDFDLDYLEPARSSLNNKAGLEKQRLRIADFITRATISEKRERALENMTDDSWAPVRATAIRVLGRNRASASASLETLLRVANRDKARSLRNRAKSILLRHRLSQQSAFAVT